MELSKSLIIFLQTKDIKNFTIQNRPFILFYFILFFNLNKIIETEKEGGKTEAGVA
jgi:Flp pilus assembly protein protease CpaA